MYQGIGLSVWGWRFVLTDIAFALCAVLAWTQEWWPDPASWIRPLVGYAVINGVAVLLMLGQCPLGLSREQLGYIWDLVAYVRSIKMAPPLTVQGYAEKIASLMSQIATLMSQIAELYQTIEQMRGRAAMLEARLDAVLGRVIAPIPAAPVAPVRLAQTVQCDYCVNEATCEHDVDVGNGNVEHKQLCANCFAWQTSEGNIVSSQMRVPALV